MRRRFIRVTSKAPIGWIAAGLGVLASIATGVLVGEQASAEMNPFYMNAVANAPAERNSREVVIVDHDADRPLIETPDFANVQAVQEASYADDR